MVKTLFKISCLISLFATLSGCFVYDPTMEFLKQRYINTTAYFNTFYNARQAFSEAVDEVQKAKKEYQDKGQTDNKFVIPSTAKSAFNTSIEKNSKILGFYPTSKWVDEALLMIGEAYSYMGDDVKAERKYLELFAKYPTSDLIPEAKLWYGLGLLNQEKNDQGIKQLQDLIDQSKSSDSRIAGKAATALADFYYKNGTYDQALSYYTTSLDYVSSGDDKSLAYYQIGLCNDGLEKFKEAEESFSRAAEEGSTYSTIFRATFKIIEEKVKQKKYQDALEMISGLLNDSKNTEYFSKLNLEMANIYYKQGEIQKSIAQYCYVDTSFAKTDESARSYYALGNIFENDLVIYDSARTYYNKAKSEYAASKITADASEKANIFNKYAQLYTDMFKYDSLFSSAVQDLARLDSLGTRGFISVPPQKTTNLQDSTQFSPASDTTMVVNRDSLARLDSIARATFSKEVKTKQAYKDSMQRSIVRTKFDLAGLFFLEIQQPDSALYWYRNIIQHYPHSNYISRSYYSLAEILRSYKHAPQNEIDSIYRLIISKDPKSVYAQESRKYLGLPLQEQRKDSVTELFEYAETLADSQRYIDAIREFEQIAQQHNSSPITPKALYSAGWYYENALDNNDSAVAVYKKLLKLFPSSEFAGVVRTKVTIYDNDKKRIEMEKQIEQERKEQEKIKQATADSLNTQKKEQ